MFLSIIIVFGIEGEHQSMNLQSHLPLKSLLYIEKDGVTLKHNSVIYPTFILGE